jgi:hypothetical protein
LIGSVVILIGIGGIVAISWVALHEASDKDETSRLIFASVLPLLGTWVGAVLAFYFSRENLQAASETTLNAVRAGGASVDSETLVAAAMTPVHRIRPKIEVADDAAAQAQPLASIYGLMKASGQSRVPILTNDTKALYVVHEPDIDKFAQQVGVSATALPATSTLALLLADAELASAISSFASVLPHATLGEARAALNRVAHAKDVFVTESGDNAGKVLGWLTNSDLSRLP